MNAQTFKQQTSTLSLSGLGLIEHRSLPIDPIGQLLGRLLNNIQEVHECLALLGLYLGYRLKSGCMSRAGRT